MGNNKKEIENSLYASLFNHASIGVIVVDGQGQITTANPYVLKLFGYSDKELLGQKIEVLIPKRYSHEQKREQYAKKPVNRPMGLGMDLFGIKKSGEELPVEISLAHYVQDGEKYYIAFINDISKRKEAERELLALNEDLERQVNERTEHLKEALEKERELGALKSRFVSVASHEFRTPLSTVASSTYLLSQYNKTEDQPKREKHIQRILNSIKALNDILDDFLSESKIEEGKVQILPKTLNLKEVIEDTLQDLNATLRTGQKVIYVHEGSEDCKTDLSAIKHILQNLTSNAIKFSPEHAEIKISSKVVNNTIEIHVKDQGIGIPKSDQEHLFERFHRAENASHIQGTGLGLHIVSKYIEMMKGSIECNSEENVGTEFIVVLNEL